MKFVFNYSPNCGFVSDFETKKIEKEYVNIYKLRKNVDATYNFNYSHGLPFLIMRTLIAEGKIPHDIVEFRSNDGIDFSPNEYGFCKNYPEQMNIDFDYITRSSKSALERRKKDVE